VLIVDIAGELREYGVTDIGFRIIYLIEDVAHIDICAGKVIRFFRAEIQRTGFSDPDPKQADIPLNKRFVRIWLSFVWAAMWGTERFAGFLFWPVR